MIDGYNQWIETTNIVRSIKFRCKILLQSLQIFFCVDKTGRETGFQARQPMGSLSDLRRSANWETHYCPNRFKKRLGQSFYDLLRVDCEFGALFPGPHGVGFVVSEKLFFLGVPLQSSP